jgi:DNA repair photolyase
VNDSPPAPTAAASIHGRGAASNPPNRFEPIQLERDADWNPEDDPAPRTQFLRDSSATIINYNDSPDVGFDASVNPYRGCEHGCIYCYARPTHEFLGMSSGLDFESRILVKLDAPALLRRELASQKWKPQVIAMSGVTDCYQPAERRLRLTRGCLEVLAEFRNPVGIVTKNHLVTRDIDLLRELAAHQAAAVFISITTLDATLTPRLEPRASLPAMRLRAIEELSAAGIPVGVMVAPIIPAITDHEIPRILAAARKAGAKCAGRVVLRLPYEVKNLFDDWLARHFPDRREKVLHRIESLRGGKLNDARFGSRMTGEGIFSEQIERLFNVGCRKAGFVRDEMPSLSTAAFRRPGGVQIELL